MNDFEYDTGAKEWMPWSYFKNFLEGGCCKVARPKNRGGNTNFTDSAPVFLTAPDEVTLKRRGREVESETNQMRTRMCYLELKHSIPEHAREEVLRVCPHCAAKLYLEGRAVLDAAPPALPALPAPAPALLALPPAPASLNEERAAKRQRPASVRLQELKDLKALLDDDLLSLEEFGCLRTELLTQD